MDNYLPKLKLPADYSKALYGAHYITGRIIDLPLKGDYGEAESKPADRFPRTPAWPDCPSSAMRTGKEGQAQIIAVVKQMRLKESDGRFESTMNTPRKCWFRNSERSCRAHAKAQGSSCGA